MRIKSKATNIILATTVVALFSGCTKEPEPKIQEHTDISQKLKRIMHDMNSAFYERHKSELERDEQKQRYAFKLSETLITVSQKTKSYPQESNQECFKNPEKRDTFLSLADQLKLHGENIRSIASTYNMKALNEEIRNMTVTCNHCHVQFNPNGPKIQ